MHILTSPNGRILDALRAGLDCARNAILASAYVTSSGIALVYDNLEALLVRGGTLSLYVTFTGGPFTEPTFFKQLGRLESRFPGQVEVYLYPHPTSLFHAKTFLFEQVDRSWSGIIGSANLTEQALTGENFEISVSATRIAHGEVEALLEELSRLRTRGDFCRLTAELADKIVPPPKGGVDEHPERTASAERRAQAKRKQVTDALVNLKPFPLPPLPKLLRSAAVVVEDLAGTGVGIATDDDLADLSVSVDLGVFVRAKVLAKETTKKIGFVSENTKKGHSFSLIDDEVRQTVKTARKCIGKTIGMRAVDFGYLRWMPRGLYHDAREAITAKEEVNAARRAVAPQNMAIARHLLLVRRSFDANMAEVVDGLKLQPKEEWDAAALRRHEISVNVSTIEMRKLILKHIVEQNGDRVSEPLVRSQLDRLTFTPRSFAFPVAQVHGADAHYGHKHFLANVIWACTDRLLKRTSEEAGTGVLFEYLDARRKLNQGRHNLTTLALAERAAAWLDPSTALEIAVEQFREIYGPDAFTWDLKDLAPLFPSIRKVA
jgi:HKD family nuclease